MSEKEALNWLRNRMPVGDDCYLMEWGTEKLVVTTDMLHRSSDFPSGTTDYTIGWRSVAVSFSDIAAMGGDPEVVVIAYGNDCFEEVVLSEFVAGAKDLSQTFGAEIVGGDLDRHDELTVVTTALGKVERPVTRKGAEPGHLVAVTGNLGRTGAGLKLFERGEFEQANELFRFEPRVRLGKRLSPLASSMMDVSDGLARSLHQLAELNEVGFKISADKIPYLSQLEALGNSQEKEKLGLFTGEDFELLLTARQQDEFELAKSGATVIGEVTEERVEIVKGGQVYPLEDEGYVH